jgi:antitoxin HigA-1
MLKSSTITEGASLLRGMRPVHPGEVLRCEYLEPLALSASALARALGVPTNRVTALIHETRGMTAETALLLSKYFRTSAEFWLNMQRSFDLRTAEQNKQLTRKLAKVKPHKSAA